MQRVILLLMLLVGGRLGAQVGISVGYESMSVPSYEQQFELNDPFLGKGYAVGIDYWLRLKNYRVEFFPELSFAQHRRTDSVLFGNEVKFDFKRYAFSLNTNIYPFDFLGDCDCPTFSKQNTFFKKGFFLQVSPSVARWQNTWEQPAVSTKASSTTFGVGLGAGLDIGLSDFATITPFVRYTRHFGLPMPFFTTDDYDVNLLVAGLRFGARWKRDRR